MRGAVRTEYSHILFLKYLPVKQILMRLLCMHVQRLDLCVLGTMCRL